MVSLIKLMWECSGETECLPIPGVTSSLSFKSRIASCLSLRESQEGKFVNYKRSTK